MSNGTGTYLDVRVPDMDVFPTVPNVTRRTSFVKDFSGRPLDTRNVPLSGERPYRGASTSARLSGRKCARRSGEPGGGSRPCGARARSSLPRRIRTPPEPSRTSWRVPFAVGVSSVWQVPACLSTPNRGASQSAHLCPVPPGHRCRRALSPRCCASREQTPAGFEPTSSPGCYRTV